MQMAAQTAGGCSDAQGTLPACAPLATPYVPFQNDNPQATPPLASAPAPDPGTGA